MIKNIQKKGKKKIKKKNQGQENHTSPELQSYYELLMMTKKASYVIIILDARNPISCRYLEYEETTAEKMIFVLNKIDLIPREIAVAWYRALQSIAPTFAVSAKYSIQPILDFLIANSSEEAHLDILITGVHKTGKTTILNKIEEAKLPYVKAQKGPPWQWIFPTVDLVSLGACDISTISSTIIGNARDFLSRCSIHSLMEKCRVTFFNDVEVVLKSFDNNKRNAAFELINGLISQKILYYTLPPAIYVTEDLNEVKDDAQKKMFHYSSLHDEFLEPLVILGYGTPNNMKPSILSTKYLKFIKTH